MPIPVSFHPILESFFASRFWYVFLIRHISAKELNWYLADHSCGQPNINSKLKFFDFHENFYICQLLVVDQSCSCRAGSKVGTWFRCSTLTTFLNLHKMDKIIRYQVSTQTKYSSNGVACSNTKLYSIGAKSPYGPRCSAWLIC